MRNKLKKTQTSTELCIYITLPIFTESTLLTIFSVNMDFMMQDKKRADAFGMEQINNRKINSCAEIKRILIQMADQVNYKAVFG